MNNEELDSQLSAMFDDELPAPECELLARRLSRDEQLKARWGRYAAIGATIRAEGGGRLNMQIARRVSIAVAAEPAVSLEPAAQLARPLGLRWWRPVAGVAVAASVAAGAILFLRSEALLQDGSRLARSGPIGAVTAVGRSLVASTGASAGGADSYVVPKPAARRSIVPATQLANYVVAHSEFSSPVNRRNLLSSLMVNEPAAGAAQNGSEESTEDVNDDAQSAK